jgi:hypothetical protein
MDELNAQHADHITRKIETPARVQALAIEGELQPEYQQFRSEKMIAIAGNVRHQAAIKDTRDRIQNLNNREPSV